MFKNFFRIFILSMFSANNSNINFTSRCAQIRDAQWVCRKVNSYSHISPSYINKSFQRIARPYYDAFKRGENVYKTPAGLRIFYISEWLDKLIENFRMIRILRNIGCKSDYGRVNRFLAQLKFDKMGNCGEKSFIAAAILKTNGIKDACIANLKIDNKKIDHSVCIFNSDNSPFDGIIGKNTIIVDPWVGDADFAHNMFVKYKNQYRYLINKDINSKSKMDILIPRHLYLSDTQKLALAIENPDFIYPAKSRDFMKK